MSENLEALRQFLGNPQAFAVQLEDGGYRPVREAVSDEELTKHLAGDITLGTYVNWDDKARFCVFDVDTGDDAEVQAKAISGAVRDMGVPDRFTGTMFSGRKGYHVWVLLEDWREASELRRFGRAVLALAAVQCEVFPKQDQARDLGNLVKLPWAKHRVSGMYATWTTEVPRPMPLILWENRVVPNLPVEVASSRRGGTDAERFPCMNAILTEGCEHDRNNQMFHLAVMLRRAGLTHEWVAKLVEQVNAAKNTPPLDPYEVERLLEGSEFSGPLCDNIPQDRNCGELCIKARTAGLYTRPRQLRHAAEGENVVVTMGPRADDVFTLLHDDARSVKGVLTGEEDG